MKKILVPVDGSNPSKKACHYARDLASLMPDTEIILLSVVTDVAHGSIPIRTYELAKMIEEADLTGHYVEESKKMLLEFKEEFKGMSDRVSTKCVVGGITDEILNCAKEEQIDLIVMGSRGLGAVARTFLGSVSNNVVNHSEVSVLIVK